MRILIELELFGRYCRFPRKPMPYSFFYAIGQPQVKGQNMPLELSITNEQKVKLTIKPVTPAGKPALLDGPPVWTVTGGESTLVVAEDGLSADLISGDVPGDSTFLIEADADLGEGVVSVADTIVLHVIGAQAGSLGITAGQPELK